MIYRIVISFFLSSLFFSIITIGFFYFLFFQKKNDIKKEIVYVHQVIVTKKKEHKRVVKNRKNLKKELHSKKEVIKKGELKTESAISKGGKKIDFKDIFSNVNSNIPTKKIEQKQQAILTKKSGNLEKVHKKLSKLETTFSFSNLKGDNKEKDLAYIQNKFAEVWDKIDTKVGDFITIQINISNGVIKIIVLSTNLDTIILRKFKREIKLIDISKINNFSAIIEFKSKLKGWQ